MKTALLATVAALLALISPSRADDVVPASYPIPSQSGSWVGRLADRLKGGMLGACVQKGMTREQVRRMVGEGELTLFCTNPQNAMSAGLWFYWDHGFSVFCSNDNAGALRVEEVTFWPFLE